MTAHNQFNENGVLTCQSHFMNGILDGEMRTFGPSGELQVVSHYVNGIVDGRLQIFDDAGAMVQDSVYRSGVKDGLSRLFFRERLISEQRFKAGKLHGDAISYSEAGDVTSRLSHINGDIEGEAFFMNEGQVVRMSKYSKGLLEGETSNYDRDGVMTQKATYKGNILEGPLTRYWPDGLVLETLMYHAGKPLGKPRRFDRKGQEIGTGLSRKGFMERLEHWVGG